MSDSKIQIPEIGKKITVKNGALDVPNQPILPFIEGDGIGPDIWKASKLVLDTAVEKAYSGKKKIQWMEIFAGEKANKLYGEYLPQETLDAIADYVVSIKGPLTTPVGGGIRSLNVTIRQKLELYACVRPVRYYQGTPSPMKHPEKLDVIIFRENTEDVYSGIEWKEGTPEATQIINYINSEFDRNICSDSGIGIKPMSRTASERLMKKAIDYALDNGRKNITIVHKGNIMKFTEGAFKDWCYNIAKSDYRDQIITESELWEQYNGKVPEGKLLIKDRIADAMFQQLLLRPSEYDILVTPNLTGDYLSDACAAQVGGLGIAPGSNIADFTAVFEATHGTAPKYTGMDKVNPGSLILSGVMMLKYLGWTEAAVKIEKALEQTIQNKTVTYDLARQIEGARELKSSEFALEICKNMD